MVSKSSKRNPTLLLILGAAFLGVTLYSGEIIAALIKSNLLSLSLEKVSDDGGSKNTKILANQELEQVTLNLKNVEDMLLKGNQELTELEMARKKLQSEEAKLIASVEKLKFELVDYQNEKRLFESNSGNMKKEIELVRKQNDQLQDKISSFDEVSLEKTKLEKALKKLEEKNRSLSEQVKNVPDKQKLLERSKELKEKIVTLNEQLIKQKMLIEGYEANQQVQLNNSGISELDNNDDYKKLILELKKEHRDEIGRLKSEIARTENYRGNFDELNGIKVVFSGFMGYDLDRKEIIFMTREGQRIMMVQDNFTGTLVGECGLPVISSENETRCAATIIARLLFHKNGPIMKGLEIVEVRKK
ncbi:hypothetical protein OA340_01685 [Paracoccaceae bacterium]|nr:hypothetical protein [Paracoccaceae bacterium]